jgi:hypothetical protein
MGQSPLGGEETERETELGVTGVGFVRRGGEAGIVVAPLVAKPRVGQSPLGGARALTTTAERRPGGTAVVFRMVTGV